MHAHLPLVTRSEGADCNSGPLRALLLIHWCCTTATYPFEQLPPNAIAFAPRQLIPPYKTTLLSLPAGLGPCAKAALSTGGTLEIDIA